jgi:uncharacterized membrane protein required for colicin V production
VIIAAAIPVFFLFMFIEAAAVRWFGARGRYRFADAVTDLGCGVTDQVGGAFFKTAKAFVEQAGIKENIKEFKVVSTGTDVAAQKWPDVLRHCVQWHAITSRNGASAL